MINYRELAYDKNGIPIAKSLVQPILLIMRNNKLWKTSEVIEQLANKINLSQEIRHLRSDTATHYLIFSNHVYQAMTILKKYGWVKQVKRGRYEITFAGLEKISNSYLAYASANISKGALNSNWFHKRIFSTSKSVSNAIGKIPRQNLEMSRYIIKGTLANNTLARNIERYGNRRKIGTVGLALKKFGKEGLAP